jgi:hypothetical protein|tara:strand:+ start:6874 stop:7125 length:252 start_codon:yes stop_codon:yes gene_type:complete
MPIYPVKNLETGETKELSMTVAEYDQWKKDNPGWDKDWSKGVASAVSGCGDVYSRTDGGWNEVLSKVAQVPGSKVKPQKTTHA